MIEVVILLAAPLLAGWLSLIVHRSALLHAINLTSIGVLVTAEILISRTVLNNGPFTALASLVYFDALSVFILFIIGAVGLACSFYMRSYMDDQVARGVIAPTRLNLFFFLFHMFLLSMVIATVANSVGVQWVAIEATTLATTFLIAFWRRRASLEAGWKYLILCSVGISLALFGVVLTYYSSLHVLGNVSEALNVTQLLRVADRLNPHVLNLAFIFMLVGYGTKVGLVPMHSWLPDAYTEAPAPVVAMLAGVLEVVAVYAILRMRMIVDHAVASSFTGGLLALLGFTSLVTGAFFILIQHNYKRLFAYSSIEHMGIAMIGFGVGGPLGTFGGLFHLLNHAFAKSMAFFAAGNIHRRFHTVEIGEVQGLAIAQPWTAMALMISGLALSALPPFASVVSEVQIITALAAQGVPGEWLSSTGGMVTFAVSDQFSRLGLAGVFLLSAILAFGGVLYRTTGMVWGTPPEGIIRGEIWTLGHLPIVLLTAALVGFSLFLPQPMQQLLEQATRLLLIH
ncbi:MAG TPA: proton-conducting transporter membrane subunit [Nitrospiraceae bacterium]|nr:proton-conducting transporter membrane subunit [Nitrospiraceae bacterium]